MFEKILVVVLILLVVALFLFSYMKKRKFNANLNEMRSELKPGDRVMTDSGVIGEVVESFVEGEFTYFVLKTGKGENTGFFTVHANAIYYVFDKEEKKAEKVVVKVEPKKEEVKAEQKKELAKEEKTTNEKTK